MEHFAPPVHDAPRRPDRARLGLSGMVSAFRVGAHEVEVETGHWSGLEIYRVDGKELRRVRNYGWHNTERLEVHGHVVEIESRWYPLLPVVVRVDGHTVLADLFPQLQRVKWVGLALFLPPFLVLSASTAYDLVRLAGLHT